LDFERLCGDSRPCGPRSTTSISRPVAVTDWVFTPDGAIQKLRNGKAEQNYFDPSYSLSPDDLDLKTSADLPFAQALSPK